MKSLIRNKKAISHVWAVILIILMTFAGTGTMLYMYGQGDFTPKTAATSTTNTGSNTGTNNNNGLSVANYGQHSMSTGGYSGFPGVTTTYSETTTGLTGYTVDWVSPSTLAILNPSGSNGTGSINIPKTDNGIIDAVVIPGSSAAVYVDSAQTQAKNQPYVTSAQYGPVLGNGVNYWFFTYDVNNAVPTYNAAPVYSFGVYLKPYGAITLADSVSNAMASVGTASIDEWVPWTTTFASVNHAFAVTKIVLTVNTTTSTNLISVDDFAVPWSANVISAGITAAPSQATLGSTDFTYTASQGLQGAQIVQYTTAVQNSLSFKVHVTCNFIALTHLNCVLTIYGLNTDGKTVVTTTDTVELLVGSTTSN